MKFRWMAKEFVGGLNNVIKPLCCAGPQAVNDCLVQQCAVYKDREAA